MSGCPVCEATGIVQMSEHDQPETDTWDAILAADFAESGAMAVQGGWLEQAAQGMAAIRYIWAEQADWRSRND